MTNSQAKTFTLTAKERNRKRCVALWVKQHRKLCRYYRYVRRHIRRQRIKGAARKAVLAESVKRANNRWPCPVSFSCTLTLPAGSKDWSRAGIKFRLHENKQ